jgi:hypothetical protein
LSCARSTILWHHVAFNICSSSNISAFNRAHRSEAVSLLLEKTRSHGTDDAWLGRMLRAMRANVGYAVAWFCTPISKTIEQTSKMCLPTTSRWCPCLVLHLQAHTADIAAIPYAILQQTLQREAVADADQIRIGMSLSW